MRIIIAAYLTIAVICMCMIGCTDPSTDPALTINYPKGGETMSIGDTVTISFRANADSLSGARIQVTSDDGLHYFHVVNDTLLTTGSGVTTYKQQWTVGREDEYDHILLYADTVFALGEDPSWNCRIKVYAHDNNQIQVTSKDFTVNFKTPYYIRYPIGGETYDTSDTIPVIFTFRTDSMSAIQYFYWSIELEVWSQLTKATEICGGYDYSLETYKRLFIPLNPNNIDPIGDSTKIMIRQYPVGKMVQSGWFTIKK